MSMISFKRGSNLNNLTIADGQFIVNTAEKSIYVDVGAERLRIGDFVSVANVDALPASGAHTTALYYVEDINCLAKWDGSTWIQINRDTGVKEVKVAGEGNAITAASYDANTRILTLTKGETFATPAVVDTKISDKVGEIDGTVKAYVDEKTSGIASDAALNALTNRVSAAEGEIDVLQAAIGEGGSVTNAIADAKKAGTDAAAAVTALENGQVKTNKEAIEAINNETTGILAQAKTYADGKDTAIAAAKAAADAAQADIDTLEGKVGTVPADKTVIGLITTAQAQADKGVADAAAAKAVADAIAADYLKANDKTELQGNIDKKVDQTTYDTKVAALESADTTLQNNINAEAKARKDADDAQVARIATLEGQITGLSGAMHFEGVKAEIPADVSGYEAGDVIIVGEKEYVFNGTAFVEFGDVSAEGDRIAALETTVGKAAEGENPATGLVKSVADNASAIATEKSRAEAKEAELAAADTANLKAAKDYADEQITALNIGDYAKNADLDTHTADTNIHITAEERTKWNTAEGKAHTHTNKALLDTYTQTEEDLADAVSKKHSHANAAELAKIADGDKAKWDAAQANAEATAAAALSTAKTELEGKITAEATTARAAEKANADAIAVLNGTGEGSVSKALTDAKAYTDALRDGQVTTNKNDIASLTQQLTWGEF